jgi:hypothetical protein
VALAQELGIPGQLGRLADGRALVQSLGQLYHIFFKL